MRKQPLIEPLGCEALIIRFGRRIEPQITPRIRVLSERIAALHIHGLLDQVPAYTTLTLHFDLRRTSYQALRAQIKPLLNKLADVEPMSGRQVIIPVCYHPELGPDLERVARYHRISVDAVIKRHARQTYQVYAIGFAPGFAYLGEVTDDLATPRLETPRTAVPAGSVAIADRQTAVYPVDTPGGWNIIGRTAMPMFDRNQPGLCPLKIGDEVQFRPISQAEFIKAGGHLDD